jgi:hypothetical protein
VKILHLSQKYEIRQFGMVKGKKLKIIALRSPLMA